MLGGFDLWGGAGMFHGVRLENHPGAGHVLRTGCVLGQWGYTGTCCGTRRTRPRALPRGLCAIPISPFMARVRPSINHRGTVTDEGVTYATYFDAGDFAGHRPFAPGGMWPQPPDTHTAS